MTRTAEAVATVTPHENKGYHASGRGVPMADAPPINNASARPANSNQSNGRSARYPHIKDLQMEAQKAVQNYEQHSTIRQLLDQAESATKRVSTDVSFKRPDRAYVEYIICSEILLNIIPNNKDFVSIGADRGEWKRRYQSLQKQNDSQNSMIKQIYDMIVEDNTLNHTAPSRLEKSPEAGTSGSHGDLLMSLGSPGALTTPASPTVHEKRPDEVLLDKKRDESLQTNEPAIRQTPTARQASPLRRERPAVQPKPPNLRGSVTHATQAALKNAQMDDQLAERFARLRNQSQSESASQDERHHARGSKGVSSSSDSTSLTSEFSESTGNDSHYDSRPALTGAKPLGPRSMPVVPPKIPLSPIVMDQQSSLPRPPQPAYDPSKITGEAGTKSVSTNRQVGTSSASDRSPRSANRPTTRQTASNSIVPPSRSSSMQPPQSMITPAELHERFPKANILVIDVRSREEFDSGHILAKNIICVEPVGMRAGMSSEELEDRLVNSPNSEQALFDKLDTFDYVVYYDQSTKTNQFLSGPPNRTEANHLRALHDILYEFNDYKPLRRRPLMIRGGLDSWIDLMGAQSLTTSTTAVFGTTPGIRRTGRITRKPLGRLPSASANSSLEVRKRRLREQKPLNADEEKLWLEKAQKEEVNSPVVHRDQSDSDVEQEPATGVEPRFVHSYEDFLRRFPEPATVQQPLQTISTAPRKGPPSVPPPPPPLHALPGVPSRPAPAMPRMSYSGVSDQRYAEHAPISRQTSAAQQPLYTSRSLSRSRKLPRTGLVNFGVTCYMNATLQCLLATMPFSQFFLSEEWRAAIRKNWKGSNGILPEYVAYLIRSLWANDDRPVRPKTLRDFCARLKDDWGIDRQQDAKEFFDFLVDCLHEDLNSNFSHNPLPPLNDREERAREAMPVQKAAKYEWERYTYRENSRMLDLFAGQHASRLRCTTCNCTSTTFEPFYSISVEIPRHSPKRHPWDIHNCLRSYCHEEKLSGDEVWKCPKCKKEREATKQITITRAPQFLVVHFKRFEMKKGDAKKVHTPINFPLYGLDFGDYMVPSDPAARTTQEVPELATTGPYLYDCYAVMRHIGNTGNGGHYICFVHDRTRGCWRKFDDDHVTDIDPTKLKGDKSLQNEQAYLVFYERAAPR